VISRIPKCPNLPGSTGWDKEDLLWDMVASKYIDINLLAGLNLGFRVHPARYDGWDLLDNLNEIKTFKQALNEKALG